MNYWRNGSNNSMDSPVVSKWRKDLIYQVSRPRLSSRDLCQRDNRDTIKVVKEDGVEP